MNHFIFSSSCCCSVVEREKSAIARCVSAVDTSSTVDDIWSIADQVRCASCSNRALWLNYSVLSRRPDPNPLGSSKSSLFFSNVFLSDDNNRTISFCYFWSFSFYVAIISVRMLITKAPQLSELCFLLLQKVLMQWIGPIRSQVVQPLYLQYRQVKHEQSSL